MEKVNIPEMKPLWLEVKKNKNKALLFCCLGGWSICILTYAYQFLGGFVHCPYWIILHLLALSVSIFPTITGAPPVDSPPSIPMQFATLLVSLFFPLLAQAVSPGGDSDTPNLDWILLASLFYLADAMGCLFVASLTRLKYTHYWPLVCLLIGLGSSSAYGLRADADEPLVCKIVVCCSAVAVATLATLFLYLRRRRLVSDESQRLTFSRCFV